MNLKICGSSRTDAAIDVKIKSPIKYFHIDDMLIMCKGYAIADLLEWILRFVEPCSSSIKTFFWTSIIV